MSTLTRLVRAMNMVTGVTLALLPTLFVDAAAQSVLTSTANDNTDHRKKGIPASTKNCLTWPTLIPMLGLVCATALVGSCTTTKTKYRDVPSYEMKRVPYEATEKRKVWVSARIPKAGLWDPNFQASDGIVNIGIVPFSSSVSARNSGAQGAGEEVAGELEHRLFSRIMFFQDASATERKDEFNRVLADLDYFVPPGLFEQWSKRNQVQRYEILNRNRIQALLLEKGIQDSKVTGDLILSHASLLGMDCLITGHVKDLSNGRTSFIMKVTSAESSRLLFSDRFEGEYEPAFEKAVAAFFYNIKRDGTAVVTEHHKETQTVAVTKYKTKKVQVGTEKEKYTVEEDDWLMTIYMAFAIGGLFML